jgi:1-acyl-sn-glycerol-3-phosphate acyltransferase
MSRHGYDPDSLERRDPALIRRLLPVLEFVDEHYFHLVAEGAEHLPRGPAILVANHNGGIMGPDLFCTLAVLWRALGPEHPLHALAHDFAMRQLRPLGWFLQKLGAVAATPANAERVLEAGGTVLVYPGGDLDAYRHFARRHEVVIVPRTGYVRVAQRMNVPVVPIVAQGAHSSAIIFSEGRWLAERLRMPRWARLERFPLALALPWGVAPGPWLPYLPLPFPIRLRVLPAERFAPGVDADAASRHVQARMQAALDELRHAARLATPRSAREALPHAA